MTDNLNRATSIGGVSCTNDVLGNRLTKGSNTMTWDSLNRMLTYNSTSYVYRADGMRVKKSSATGSTVYRYDGQMGMEDVEVAGANTTVTDYAIGARGIDGIRSAVNGGGSSLSYPIYDAHGNMISTLARNGTGYTYSATRGFDAWGVIRVGGQNGDPKGRYCASLGHKQDDESGLTYMRARYYEPSSGRFVNEDPARSGRNWFAYASLNPVGQSDKNGRSAESEALAWKGSILITLGWLMMVGGASAGLICSLNSMFKLIDDFTKLGGMFAPGTPGFESLRVAIELIYYGLEQPGTPRNLAGGAAAGLAAGYAGYLMIVQGYILMADAEFSDSYSQNMGLFGYMP